MSKIVDEAIKSGIVEVVSETSAEYAGVAGIKDKLGDGKIHFHDEMPRVKFAELVGRQFVVRDIKIVPDWEGLFTKGDMPLILIELPDGAKATTIGSGIAVLRQCRRLTARRGLLPVKVQLQMTAGSAQPYYEMVNPS